FSTPEIPGFDRRRRAVASPALCFVSPDEARENRDEDHNHDDDFDVLVNSRNIDAQKISNAKHAPDPAKGADDVERDEVSESHSSNACHHRRKRPDDGYELG